MNALIFTPPATGLMAFSYCDRATYGVYLGAGREGYFKVYTPTWGGQNLEIAFEDTGDYDCRLCGHDYNELTKHDSAWWAGFLIEVNGRRHQVTGARRSFPTYEWFMIQYRNGEISHKDSRLKFVGHIQAQ